MEFFNDEKINLPSEVASPVDECDISAATKILHDLCASSSVILSAATYLDDATPEQLKKYRDIIIRNSYIFLNKLDIVTNLLSASSSAADISAFDICDILSRMNSMIEPFLQRSSRSIRIAQHSDSLLVYGNCELISKALFGIISVAMQYNAGDEPLNISIKSDGTLCNIAVSFFSPELSRFADTDIFQINRFDGEPDIQFISACLTLCRSCSERSGAKMHYRSLGKEDLEITLSIPMQTDENVLVVRAETSISNDALRTNMYTALSHLIDFSYERQKGLYDSTKNDV
ncbi:MAG: HAMP domain-containing histidine kinase [Ruminococcaceae bacterium]|nr:HAMP domain-containing histidine kinase [Oscillospiraceae bacterium]